MPRFLSQSLRTALDFVVLSIAYWLAFLFRFEFQIPRSGLNVLLFNWPYVALVQYFGLRAFDVPRMSWRYINIRDTLRVAIAVAASTGVLVVFRLVLPQLGQAIFAIPLGVIAMDLILAFVGLVGVRGAWRIRAEVIERGTRRTEGIRHRALLIGAGQAGVLVAHELARRPDLGLQAVGYLDDDPLKIGTQIAGLRVLGSTSDVAEIAQRMRARRALIAIANASGAQIRRINQLCRDAGLETKIIPGIYELVGNNVNLSRIREVAIEDLLGREPVALDEENIGATIRGRVVFVTGAGGSIGSDLCRILCQFGPQRLVLVERFENALFEIHRELVAAFPHVALDPRVADVSDEPRMIGLFEAFKPDLVFHAAAHKHVPMMEWNPGEAVKNNIGGTRVVADLSHRFGVERFVLISTDKAVNPSSVMGASKRVAEIYTQAMSQRSKTRYVTVRFGNVLGSAGSAVPIFREQISRGGPVTVTHPDMTRYFMTIREASQLVLQAGAMGSGGEIFILDMGKPVRIVDLAHDLISLSGLRPGIDIEVKYTGVRPGEKLREELATDSEKADKTKHPKIYIGRINPHEWAQVLQAIDGLMAVANDGADAQQIRGRLCEIVPEYQLNGPIRTLDDAVDVDEAIAPN